MTKSRTIRFRCAKCLDTIPNAIENCAKCGHHVHVYDLVVSNEAQTKSAEDAAS